MAPVGRPGDRDLCAAERQAALGEPAHRQRIEAVLLAQDARGERVGRVARQHRHRGLGDDRAGIEVGRDEMHRAAADARAGIERLLLGVQARERPAAARDGC